ncbi:hypothetical protein CEXT_252381 [Caerostris extrusa]|uniref:Uncharacterized protein n=1 Tax=Caerostris extrusa TaxID=172846 RepID=A0AAV4QJE2_CAEEX|nr:hypothetical protein CEXT_252381 [Caerostris extrusa]
MSSITCLRYTIYHAVFYRQAFRFQSAISPCDALHFLTSSCDASQGECLCGDPEFPSFVLDSDDFSVFHRHLHQSFSNLQYAVFARTSDCINIHNDNHCMCLSGNVRHFPVEECEELLPECKMQKGVLERRCTDLQELDMRRFLGFPVGISDPEGWKKVARWDCSSSTVTRFPTSSHPQHPADPEAQPPHPAERRQPQEPDFGCGNSPSSIIPSNTWRRMSSRSWENLLWVRLSYNQLLHVDHLFLGTNPLDVYLNNNNISDLSGVLHDNMLKTVVAEPLVQPHRTDYPELVRHKRESIRYLNLDHCLIREFDTQI